MTPILSAKISWPSLSTTPQRSPSPSKPSATSAPRRLHRLRHGVQHVQVFGVRVVARKGQVEIAVERDDLDAERAEQFGAKAPAVPLPQAATTFILRVNFGRLVRSAM